MGAMVQLMSSSGATMKSQVEDKIGEEVLAVGQLKQRRTPSMAAMMTGTPGNGDGTLDLAGELVPVCRPNMDGDPETDALIALLRR